MLREPVKRYISEWKHVSKGATWREARLMCNGKPARLPFCYKGKDWKGVTFDEFINCPYNLATNRQTRMLSNLTLINCYNDTSFDKHERGEIMLQSAKANLLNMDYFGLTEYQTYSQELFEHTFDLEFNKDFEQSNETQSDKVLMSKTDIKRVIQLNKLDIELYQFAKELFLQRIMLMKRQQNKLNNRVENAANNGK